MTQTHIRFAQAMNIMIENQNRDRRLDLIRGLALWMIFVDHIPHNLLSYISYRHIAYSDASDIFVFISGISCCLLYARLFRTVGFARAQMRALRRVYEIYVGYICVALATVACFYAFRGVLGESYTIGNNLTLLADEPLRAVSAMLWTFYTPQYLDILPLYMILVAATPLMLFVLMRSEVLALSLSVGIWFVARTVPQVNVPSLDDIGVVSLNPFSWQLLFYLGLWVGKRYFVDNFPFRSVPWLQVLCWLVVVGGAITRHADWLGFTEFTALERVHGVHHETNEQIVPLVNLLAGAYLTACYLPANSALLRSKWLSPMLVCGRHSLEVFCVGIGLSIFSTGIFALYNTTLAIQLAVNGTGLAAMTAVALLLEKKRTRHPIIKSTAFDR
jgi:hypothetical protein